MSFTDQSYSPNQTVILVTNPIDVKFSGNYQPLFPELVWYATKFNYLICLMYFSLSLSLSPVCLSVHVSWWVCLFAHVSLSVKVSLSVCTYLSVYLSTCLPACLSLYLPICLSMCLSAYLPVSQSVRMSVCTCLSVYRSACLPDCLFVHLFFWDIWYDDMLYLSHNRSAQLDRAWTSKPRPCPRLHRL